MKITRIFTGEDGESHFEDFDIATEHSDGTGRRSSPIKATGVVFKEAVPDYGMDWHKAPRRQYMIRLEGSTEIEVGDGTKRQFGPGTVLLAEDTTGRGHRSSQVGSQPPKTLFVILG